MQRIEDESRWKISVFFSPRLLLIFMYFKSSTMKTKLCVSCACAWGDSRAGTLAQTQEWPRISEYCTFGHQSPVTNVYDLGRIINIQSDLKDHSSFSFTNIKAKRKANGLFKTRAQNFLPQIQSFLPLYFYKCERYKISTERILKMLMVALQSIFVKFVSSVLCHLSRLSNTVKIQFFCSYWHHQLC